MEEVAGMRELVGQPIRRVEDPRLLRGEGRFVDDLRVEGTLHAAFVRAPHGHARLRSLDLEAARAAPGVVAAFSVADLPELDKPVPATAALPPGSVLHTPVPMAKDVAHYTGEIVAVLVAENRYAAEDALERVEADWEPLPAVTDLATAAAPGGSTVWEDAPGNVATRYRRGFGDADAAFSGEDVVTVRERFTIARSAGGAIEPRTVLASSRGVRPHPPAPSPH